MQRYWIFLCFFIPLASHAQQQPHQCKNIAVSRAEILLDSLTVIPESIYFESDILPAYHFDINTGTIYFADGQLTDSVKICYQTIPFRLHHTHQRKDLAAYNEQKMYTTTTTAANESVLDEKVELFPTDNLQKSGSLSRGISFGNTQNVVVNSALNLQLEGKLGDDLHLRASITDQNVPFQPEGNTAQIPDFDNILIELYNDNFSLKGGDVVLSNKESHFLRYYKNVQGGLASVAYKTGKNSSAVTDFGISVAKGKFASLLLEAEEGVSGPYRITIPNTSDFVIIMANSEKVFLDGKLLQRGYNYDYVIDYNKAEIQFTSQVLITKFSRIRIDVEYSDQNYSRTILSASHYQQVGKASFAFNYYSEKDNPNNPLTTSLSQADKELMQGLGDQLSLAVRQSAQQVAYNQNEVLYQLADTLDEAGSRVQIFKYTRAALDTLYRVSFSEVGSGKGDYNLTNSTANGRIYTWVSPINGVKQGKYAPQSRIPAPNKKQMITLGGGYQVSKYESVFAEVAFSENDLNLFSTLDSHDDNGFAVKGGLKSEKRPVGFLKDYLMTAQADFEYDDAYFSPIDRFRYIEFDRDWNYAPGDSADQSADHIFNAALALEKNGLNRFGYKMVRRKRDMYIDGTQHYLDYAQSIGRLQLVADAFILRNKANTFEATWNKVNTDVYYQTKWLVPGYKFSLDENEMRAPGTDSIISTLMNFQEHRFYLNSNDSLKTRFGISQTFRTDRSPQTGILLAGNESQTTQLFVHSDVNPGQRIHFLLTYRNNLNHLAAGGPKNEETLMARTDWYAAFFKRHVKSDLTYAIGNSRELKREFVYVPVPTGEGTHTWRDDNADGVQDLSEFYIAINADEKNYIKIFVPTSEFIFAYENNFNYRLNIDLPRSWKDAGAIKKLLSRISTTSSWNIVKRITSPDLQARILPFYNNFPDEDLLSLKETIRGRIFYNRANPGLGLDFGYLASVNKQLMSQGFEKIDREEYSANARLNVSKAYNLKLMYLRGTSSSRSDFLQGRNYSIDRIKVQPEIAWQPSPVLRLAVLYGYSDKVNSTGEAGEKASINELATNVRVSKATDLSLDGFVKYSGITYNGETNAPVAYEMLEALQPGKNYTWSLTVQKKILLGLQLSMSYEGRKSEANKAVHIGRMQVSALF
ncbi:MAG: hypothetical protein HC819_04340 [Cyclobacteriaceae bacterium]|nr:hypothetical protein [Cyclobacteriaceae bacterium]